jgi:hypothetical protein
MAMPHVNPTAAADRVIGSYQRASQEHQEFGTVIEHNGSIKVKWTPGELFVTVKQPT